MARWGSCTLVLVVATVLCSSASAAETQHYPGTSWEQIPPAQSGWSDQRLDQAWDYARGIGSTAVVVVQHGVIVASWGETHANLLLNSARKSLLSALMGIAVQAGQVHLNDTLARLGIDDNRPSLTAEEKQATVRDLLEARSGVYHPANYETTEMEIGRPQRGSHPPGTFWFYNNWDFNTLGAIFEHATGSSVFTAFAKQIAEPVGMQDFDPAKCRYVHGPNSQYPAYLFYASARDLARFGLLYLRKGRWGDRQIIPAAWVRESTQPYSTTNRRTGYGYLWWTMAPTGPSRVEAPLGTYWAEGNGGQIVFVVPAYDVVVVHVAREGSRQVRISAGLRLIERVLAARPGS
jgi:CubicO group peptidase (beta-lactamase class C family)